MRRDLYLLVAAAFAALAAAAPTQAAFAPLDRPGPKLQIPREKLRASVDCSDGVRDAATKPVLLFPATSVDSHSNFSWNYERLFTEEGIPYCTSDQQGFRGTNMADVQTRGQYVTYAIRKVFRIAGRPIAVMGHSQGGMVMRIGLRFWPDTRRKVSEVIGLAGTNHGSVTIREANCAGGCSAAFRQQQDDARFIRALNSRTETFAGISYTEIFTEHDQVVTPPAEASSVSGPGRITNVAVQEICPGNGSEHLTVGTTDAVAAALVLDALAKPGPADPARIDPLVCAQQYMGGVNPATVGSDIAAAAAQLAATQASFPHSDEPRLRCWTKLRPKLCRRERRAAR